MQKSKVAYSKSIVNDLKSSNPSQWYSKVKRMSNINRVSDDDYFIEEFCDLNLQTQADQLVNFYASTRNQFQSISEDDFQSVFDNDLRQDKTDILTTPEQVENIILSMNKKSSCIVGDIPFKILHYFSSHISKPLSIFFNTMFEQNRYPELWKTEYITPVAKCFPVMCKKNLRPISGPLSFAKVSDKLFASYILQDMDRDVRQYGNEKGLSTNHYLVKMINKILMSIDKNSNLREKCCCFDHAGLEPGL